jgi:hypothetical protein
MVDDVFFLVNNSSGSSSPGTLYTEPDGGTRLSGFAESCGRRRPVSVGLPPFTSA